MTAEGQPVRTGMEVVGSDGDRVGDVKDVLATGFFVRRQMAPDLYVPLDAVRGVEGVRVILGVPAGHVDDMQWSPPRAAS